MILQSCVFFLFIFYLFFYISLLLDTNHTTTIPYSTRTAGETDCALPSPSPPSTGVRFVWALGNPYDWQQKKKVSVAECRDEPDEANWTARESRNVYKKFLSTYSNVTIWISDVPVISIMSSRSLHSSTIMTRPPLLFPWAQSFFLQVRVTTITFDTWYCICFKPSGVQDQNLTDKRIHTPTHPHTDAPTPIRTQTA